jgi:hypothetical protein
VIFLDGFVTRFGKIIDRAEQTIIESIQDGRIEEEPSITERLLHGIETEFNESYEQDGFIFRARSLGSHGRNAAEHEFGADFCGLLDVELPEFTQSKGFLCQAKRDGNGVSVGRGPRGLSTITFTNSILLDSLRNQVTKMLNITPASFVIIYSMQGFLMLPGIDILTLKTSTAIYAMPIKHFFKDFMMCFIGDIQLNAYDDATFRQRIDESHSRMGIMFQIKAA